MDELNHAAARRRALKDGKFIGELPASSVYLHIGAIRRGANWRRRTDLLRQ